jgi:ABC-type multidrug transport system ATPase subunit
MIGRNQQPQHQQATAVTRTGDRPQIVRRTDEREGAIVPDRVSLDHGLTVGRQALPGQVVLDHPNVSRRHAAFEVVGGTIVLRDLGGTNGTYVNGARLRGTRALVPGDKIDIGPFELTFDGTALTRAWRVGNVELLVRDVNYDVRGRQRDGIRQRILYGANLRIRPSEFVAIIGANGSGKSTLMNIMAGRVLPSEGAVLLNGSDLHANFPALKQDIAFVPQQDVLHELLTLRQALDYAARLRLPPDTTVEQRRAAVSDAARNVDLLDRLDQRIGSLSGGQKKCASLASEILNRPSLLLLDEVTSGLDESTDWEIMRLLRRLADDGMTIIMVTHTLANVTEFCDKVVCMGRGGQTTFVGAPSEVLDFFAVHRLGEVFSRTDEVGAERWRARFEVTGGASANLPTAAEALLSKLPRPDIRRPREPLPVTLRHIARQGAILLHRNVRLLLADRRTLAMAVVQSVLIGGLMGYAFGNFGTGQERVNAQSALLLLLGLSAIWLGCNAASKEIVGELAIYRREHDINLSTAAFIGAKYLVSSVFTVLQLAVVYVLAAALSDGIPGDRLEQFLLLMIGAMAGTAMGLVISAFANTRDQATIIVPLALVPQLILAGVLVPKLPDLAVTVAKIAVSGYWLIEAMKSVFIAAEGPIRAISPHTGTLVDMSAQPAARGAAIVAVQALVFLLIAYLVTLLRHGGRDRTARG